MNVVQNKLSFKLRRVAIAALAGKVMLLGALTAIGGCSYMFDKHVQWEYEQPNAFPVLKAVGYAPISLQYGQSHDQKTLMAIKASKLDAYRELAEQLYGYKIDGNTSLKSMMLKDDKLEGKVQGLVTGARIVKSYAVGDVYTTEVELDTQLVYELYQQQARPKKIKKVTYY